MNAQREQIDYLSKRDFRKLQTFDNLMTNAEMLFARLCQRVTNYTKIRHHLE